MTLRPIFFDLETTGLIPKTDRIIEIAAFDPIKGTSYQTLVRPERPLSKETTEICGITDDMVAEAPLFQDIMKDFFAFCDGEIVLIAHNAEQFDLPFLFFECQRLKHPLPSHWHIVDSLKWARKFRKDLPHHSLQYLRQIFHVDENRAHRALDDVMVLWSVFSLMTDDLSLQDILDRGDSVQMVDFLKNFQLSSPKVEKAELLF